MSAEAQVDILEILMTYQGKQRRIVPGSVWFGNKNFKNKQQWWLTAKDKDLGRVVEFSLADCHFDRPAVEAIETSRIVPAATPVDPRQQTLPEIEVVDAVVGNGPGPTDTKLIG